MARDDCVKFSSSRFDQGLAAGRITREEVNQLLDRVHRKVNGFIPYYACCLVWFILWVLDVTIYIRNMIKPISKNYWRPIMLFSFIGLIGCWVCGCIFMSVKRGRLSTKIGTLLGKENEEKWHPRGIHMSCNYELYWI